MKHFYSHISRNFFNKSTPCERGGILKTAGLASGFCVFLGDGVWNSRHVGKREYHKHPDFALK